jgi:hypothetical protein
VKKQSIKKKTTTEIEEIPESSEKKRYKIVVGTSEPVKESTSSADIQQ